MAALPNSFGQMFSQDLPDSQGSVARQQQSSSRSTKDIAYKAIIACSEQNIYVDAWLPETVGVDVAANYEAPFAQGIGAINDKIGAFAQFIGMNLTTQAMTAQIWQGGSFINFQLPFIFQAETSAELEVMKPIKDLLRLAMPKDPSQGGILEAPGPHIDIKKLGQNGGEQVVDLATGGIKRMFNTASETINKNGLLGAASAAKDSANEIARKMSSALVNSVVNNISLTLGQFMYFPSIVVTDVSPTFDVMLSPDGKPMRATVNVGFRTFYIPTENDIEQMFSNNQYSQDQGQFL